METIENKEFAFGEFEVDADKRQLRRDGRPVSLNSKTFDLLLTLVTNRGKLLTKSELLDTVWENQFVEENNLTVHIAALRKALGEKKNAHQYIVTIPGKGYKFIAELKEQTAREIIVATHKIERVIIDEEEEIGNEDFKEIDTPAIKRLQSPRQTSPKHITVPTSIIYASVGAVLILLVAGIWFLRTQKPAELKQPTFTKLTTVGKVTNAVITPDKKYVAFSQKEADGESLWLRHTATGSQNKILDAQPVNFVGLTASPDGNFIYATVFSGDFSHPQIWRIPHLGGASEHIQGIMTGAAISLAPDSKRFAFTESRTQLGETHLGIADADGANKQILIRAKDEIRSFPNFETSPVAWSPDGGEIACVVEEKAENGASRAGIILVNPTDLSEKRLTEKRWNYVGHISWIDAENLAVTGSSETGNQIWLVSRSSGEARQLTSDLNAYSQVSGAAGTLVTLQRSVVSKILVGDFDKAAGITGQPIFEESGSISNVNWTRDGKILYTSQANGQSEIWRVNPDGTDKKQLTVNSKASFGVSVSPADGSLLFSSVEDGKYALYLTDSEGKNMRRVSEGVEDVFGKFTTDGKSAIFQRGLNNKIITLWRVDFTEQKFSQLTKTHSTHPAVSPDGSKTAYYFMDRENSNLWAIGIISNAAGEFLRKVNLPKEATERRMRWHPQENFITQAVVEGENTKLLFLPFDENQKETIYDLGKGDLQWFEWSPDGRKIVYSLSTETRDAVLIKF